MSSADSKYYHEHDFEPKYIIDPYLFPKADEALFEDLFINPMKHLRKELITDLKYPHEHDFEPKHYLDTNFSPKTVETLLEDIFINPVTFLHKELINAGFSDRMTSDGLKYYHEHDFEAKHFLDTFCSPKADGDLLEDVVKRPMKYLQKELTAGHIHGDLLIDISVGPNIGHLIPMSKFFKEITVLEFNDFCITEMEKWLNSHEEAYDWSHALHFMMDLEEISGGKQTIEELLKSKIKHVLKCDFTKDNPTDPIVLPKADCIISAWAMEVINKDQNDYINNFRKISSLLKPGGRLILFGSFNVSYYIVAGHRYGTVTYDEEFLRKVLENEGYITEVFQVKDREIPTDLVNYEKTVFVIAVKQRER